MNNTQEQLKQIFETTYKIECQVLDGGWLPTKAHKDDAGFDLRTPIDVVINPGEVLSIPLNIRLKFPKDCYGDITSKSGLGKKGLLVFAGVIDEGYRGVPCATITNLSNKAIVVKQNEKIAQMVMHPYSKNFYMEQVEVVDTATERSENGFGSSGK